MKKRRKEKNKRLGEKQRIPKAWMEGGRPESQECKYYNRENQLS